MSSGFPFFLSPMSDEARDLRRNWGWLLALGVALIVAGGVAIIYPACTTIIAMEVYGILLLVSAGIEVVSAVWVRRWGGFFLHLLFGLLYFFVGIVMLDRPALVAAIYTLMLAIFFVAGGLFRIVVAINQRYSGWGWTVLSGAITFLLGLVIWRLWRDYPEWASLKVIGTFLGIDFLFNGLSWVMLALAVRTAPRPDGPVTSYPS
jgi:uncharacterized membrane protein HdeD (DUF308 family)